MIVWGELFLFKPKTNKKPQTNRLNLQEILSSCTVWGTAAIPHNPEPRRASRPPADHKKQNLTRIKGQRSERCRSHEADRRLQLPVRRRAGPGPASLLDSVHRTSADSSRATTPPRRGGATASGSAAPSWGGIRNHRWGDVRRTFLPSETYSRKFFSVLQAVSRRSPCPSRTRLSTVYIRAAALLLNVTSGGGGHKVGLNITCRVLSKDLTYCP